MRSKIVHTVASDVYKQRLIMRYVLAPLVGVAGIVNMVSAIVPRFDWDMLFGAWPVDAHNGMYKLIIVCGFFILMFSYGIVRGKRQAWYAVVVLLSFSIFLHIAHHGTVLGTLLTIALLVLLLLCGNAFHAKSDPPSVWRGNIAFLIGLGVVSLYTIGGFVFLYNEFEPVVDRLGIDTVILLMLSNTHMHLTSGTQAFLFQHALPVLCFSAALYGMVLLLRPVTATLLPDEVEQQSAAQLMHLYGTNSISYFALEAGKSYFFSASQKSVISYVLEGNVAVVAGDPIGPEEEMLTMMQEFIDFCRQQDWTIVFWQVRDVFADLYHSCGLHMLKMGEDAVVDTKTFTLAGKAMANVRSSAKRAEKEGLRVVFYRGQVQDCEQLAQMERISQTWLASKGGSEMGFSMGRFDPYGDEEQITALAVSAANKVHAFVTFVPIYGRNGWGLDLMRRAEVAAPGTMELLLARSIEHLKNAGADVVSLGLATLANASCTHDDETFLHTSIDFFTRLFGNQEKNQSLFNFKKKFQPRWESRYLVFSSTLTLPRVGLALYHAHQRNSSLLKEVYRTLRAWQQQRQAVHTHIARAIESAKRPSTSELSV